jgi:hypothetical protein
MITRILFLFLAAFVFSGCLEPCPHYNRLQVATFYGAGKPIKKPYGTIKPYYTSADVPHPFEGIAFMSCEGSQGEEGAILKAMLYRAADMGADGILLDAGKIGQENTERKDVNINFKGGWMALIGNGNTCAFRAQAIRFKQ